MANYQNTVPNQLAQAAVGVSVVPLYTVPPTTRTYLKNIDVSNASSAAIVLWIYLVPSGGAPGVGNILVPGVQLPANGMLQWSGSQLLLPGQSLQASAGALGLSLIASGGEAT